MGVLALATLTLIILSAVFSASEAAIFSISENKAKELHKEGKCGNLFLKIVSSKDKYISTIVLLNNVVNIMGSVVVGGIAANVFGESWLGVFTFILTITIVMFSEIIPKAIAIRKAAGVTVFMAGPLEVCRVLLHPVVWLINCFSGSILKMMFGDITNSITSEAEIRYLATAGAKDARSEISKKEAELIHRVFDLQDTPASEIMSPRTVMTYMERDKKLGEYKDFIRESQHSRIVVIGESIDDVVGVLLKDDLLNLLIDGKEGVLIGDLEAVRPPLVVGEKTKAEAIIKIFQRQNEHMAVVHDSFGGVSGVVTLEDAFELLVGEIVDETDVAPDMQMVAKAKLKMAKKQKRDSGSGCGHASVTVA